MLPTRTLSAVCEITRASLVITSRPPIYTGEAGAMRVIVQLKNNDVDYSPSSARAEAYLYYQDTEYMSEAIGMEITGNIVSCLMPSSMTVRAGGPLLTILLKDLNTDHVLVAAAAPIQITNVLGQTVITTRPPTPSEVINVGRAPYIDPETLTWMEWDNDAGEYVDTEVAAYGRPGTFTATATGLPAGSSPTASISGTADSPVLNLGIPKGDTGAAAGFGAVTATADATSSSTPSVTVSSSGPDTAKNFNFAFFGLKGTKGDKGDKGDSGASTAEEVSTDAIAGVDNVEDAISSLNDKIDNLGPFNLKIDMATGHLIGTYSSAEQAAKWSVNSNGHLIYTI